MRQILLPPLVTLALIILSIVIGSAIPILGPAAPPVRIAGLVLIPLALAINVTSANRFRKADTNLIPYLDPDVLVEAGWFRVTRNPMYVGFLGVLIGVALAVGTASAWLGPVIFFAYATWWIIPFEEARLRDRFGESYDDYRRRVPRWVGPVGER